MSDETAKLMEGELVKDGLTPPKPKRDTKPKSVLTNADQREINLAVRNTKTKVMDPVEYAQTRLIAKDIIESGAVPRSIDNVEQVMMILKAGQEAGLDQVQSLQSFYFVNGVLKMWGAAVPRQLRKNGWKFEYFDETPTSCSVRVWRGKESDPDFEEYKDVYTYDEAVASGYTKDKYGEKAGWKPGINRKKKMRYGALGLVVATYIPEALGSVDGIVEDEIDWQTSQENAIEAGTDAKAADRRAKIEAAQVKHKQLNGGNFKPAAVPSQTQTGSDDTHVSVDPGGNATQE